MENGLKCSSSRPVPIGGYSPMLENSKILVSPILGDQNCCQNRRIMSRSLYCILILCCSSISPAQARDQDSPIAFERVYPGPLISPSGTGSQSAGTFNPAAARIGRKVVLLYRAQDKQGTSTIGYASSPDGVHF